jgi:hypothetical protein
LGNLEGVGSLRIRREKKKAPPKRAALSIGALLGNLEGVGSLGLLREK